MAHVKEVSKWYIVVMLIVFILWYVKLTMLSLFLFAVFMICEKKWPDEMEVSEMRELMEIRQSKSR